MLSVVRSTAYSVICCRGRRSGASRCAATLRPRILREHFSFNQLCQLDATAYEQSMRLLQLRTLGATTPVPASRAEWPLPVRSSDLERDAWEGARSADS